MSKVQTVCMGCMSGGYSGGICPKCGYDPLADIDKNCLAPGTVLEERYLVGALKGRNGSEAQYIGYDKKESRRVWIREYFPDTLARRASDGYKVVPREGREAQYKAFLSDFIDICSMVGRLKKNHPVIPIENTLRVNGTLYAVYSYLRVVSLESYLAREGGQIPFDKALDVLTPLFQMVGRIHVQGIIHRGISPYTVYIEQDTGHIYLGDFLLPAARTAGSELKAELYNGYSAPEQYVSNGWQGVWTDIYALGALFYRAVSGVVPPKSTLIGSGRPLAPLVNLDGNIPAEASAAIEEAMHRDRDARTQSVMQLLAGLSRGRDNTHTAVFDNTALSGANRKKAKEVQEEEVPVSKGSAFKYAFIALLGTVAVLALCLWIAIPALFPHLMPEKSEATSKTSSQSVSQPSLQQLPSSSEPERDVSVPDFTGNDISFVEDNSDYQERFIFDIREESSDIHPKGRIYEQAPKAGTPMPNRGTIILYVSKGPVTVTMPDLVGMTIEEAAEKLQETGKAQDIELHFYTYEVYEEGAEPEKIARTSPSAGDEFKPSEQNIMLFVAIKGNEVSESVDRTGNDDNNGAFLP